MTAKRYIIRTLKYMVFLTVIFAIMLYFFRAIDYIKVPLGELFHSERALYAALLILGFALIHPLLGYNRKRLTFDATQHVEQVENVMARGGYKREPGDSADRMVFRAMTSSKRMILLWEDEIVITTADGVSAIEGPRKETVKAYFRMGTFIA